MNQTIKLIASAVLAIFAAITVNAQVTTSAISGKILDSEGPVQGAAIIAVHTPSGSQFTAVSDKNGNYRINNITPGGPYTVKIEVLGYRTVENTGVYAPLGEIVSLNNTLEVEALGLEAAVFTANVDDASTSALGAGVGTAISQNTMTKLPTTSRALNDILKLTPQSSTTSNGLAIGGGNYRSSFVTVDGAAFNNAFGIGQNLPAGGAPISLDAIEQMSINITPFDVRQSGFTGGAVNAVTKRGTNEWHASVYNYYTSDVVTGRNVGDTRLDFSSSLDNTIGASVGGPIIKDKLFFFVNFEYQLDQEPSSALARPDESYEYGGSTQYHRPTVEYMNMVSNYLRDTYGYETGPFQNYNISTPDWKLMARLDWNIAKNHKLNIRYSHTMNKYSSEPSTSISPLSSDVYNRNYYSRTSEYSMMFKNSNYYQEQNFISLAAELNSSFLDGMVNNMFRATWSHQYEPRSWDGEAFPTVDILQDIDTDDDGVGDTRAVMTSFGLDPFTYGNLRDVHTITLTDEVNIIKGINNITAGVQFEYDITKNGYMQGGLGYYVFDSWDSFVNNELPAAFAITHPNNDSLTQEYPSFNYMQTSLYLQDELNIADNFKLTAGLRLEIPVYPALENNHNVEFSELANQSKTFKGLNTDDMPKARVNFSPRVGFNWDILNNRKLILRGGTGIYTGRIPFVWIVSAVGNSNNIQAQYIDNDGTGSLTPHFHDNLNDILNEMYGGNYQRQDLFAPTAPTIMDKNLKMPSSWKSSLAIDGMLPGGIKATLEGIFSKDLTSVKVYRLGQTRGEMQLPGEPETRAYWTNENVENSNGTPINPYYLTNSSKNGYYGSFTAQLQKDFHFGLSLMAAYTYSNSKSLGEGWGDQVSSAYSAMNYSKDGSNVEELGYSGFVSPNRFIANISYSVNEGRWGTSTFSLFYEGYNHCYIGNYSYSRMSYTISNAYRDYALSNDYGTQQLIYIPTVEELASMPFVDEANKQAFEEFIASDKYLSKHRGEYSTRGAVVAPWQSRFNFKFTQDFHFPVAGQTHTLQVGLDINNVANLLNKNWGLTDRVDSDRLLRFDTETQTYTYMPQTWGKYANTFNTWNMLLSVRYFF